MNLAKALQSADCKMDAHTFRELVKSLFLEKYSTWTDEDLYCRPTEAALFCNRVRQAATAPQLGEEIPLRTLTNIRKRGELPRLKERPRSASGKPARVHAKRAGRSRSPMVGTKAIGAYQV